MTKSLQGCKPWRTPFPIWNQSVVPCPVLTIASWSAYRFLKRQIRCSGIPISFRISQFIVIHTVKGFGIVNKAEIDVFLEFSCFFHDIYVFISKNFSLVFVVPTLFSSIYCESLVPVKGVFSFRSQFSSKKENPVCLHWRGFCSWDYCFCTLN